MDMARTKVDDPEARARIAAAAEELFAARGFDGTAIRDIAGKAGVNGAMIHYYFGNKEGLYRAMLEGAASRVQALLIETTGGSGSTRERLARFVDAYAAYMLSQPNLARILYREMLTGAKHIRRIAQQYAATNYTMLRKVISDGVKRGELRAIDADLAPISLMGMVVIFQFLRPIISVALGKTEYDERFVTRVATHTIDLFLYGALADNRTAKQTARRPSSKSGTGKRRSRVQT
jgi:TetR/AcrR family transcriptional regulator